MMLACDNKDCPFAGCRLQVAGAGCRLQFAGYTSQVAIIIIIIIKIIVIIIIIIIINY